MNNLSYDLYLEAKKDLDRTRKELEEARPYVDAIRQRHNGYNSEMQKIGIKEPKSPKAALDSLIGEAEALGLAESKEYRKELDRWKTMAQRHNPSGCCCQIDENNGDPKMVEPCVFHAEWRDVAVKKCTHPQGYIKSVMATSKQGENMSGGHFNYDSSVMSRFADDLKHELDINDSQEKDDYGDNVGAGYGKKTIVVLKQCHAIIATAGDLAREIEWLYSGDHGEESFLKLARSTLKKTKCF